MSGAVFNLITMKQFFLLVTLAAMLITTTSVAQSVQDTSKNPVIKQSGQLPATKTVLTPKVVGIQIVRASDYEKKNDIKTGKITAFPDNIIRFTISNPKAFLAARPTDIARVVMYANGLELKGICTGWNSNVTRISINNGNLPVMDSTADIDIVLRRNDSTQAAWNFFYSSGRNFTEHYADIHASIGWEGMSDLENVSPVATLRVAYYYSWIFWLWLSLFFIIISGFLLLALKTDALRDSKGGAFSLSLTLLFFWTLLIVGAFIYTLVLTDVATSMNSSVLLLLGVSIATSGGATAIDLTSTQKHPDLPDKPHRTFFKDILTDGNIFSIHRIQVCMWNLVLGLYFIIFTMEHKTMPVFSETLLFLAGFSSLSYLGAKIPENRGNAAKTT